MNNICLTGDSEFQGRKEVSCQLEEIWELKTGNKQEGLLHHRHDF